MNRSLFLSFLVHFLLVLVFIQPHLLQKREESRAIPVFLQTGNLLNHSQTHRVSKLPSQKPKAKQVSKNKEDTSSKMVNQKKETTHPEVSNQNLNENKRSGGKGNGNGSSSVNDSPSGSSGVGQAASEYATELIAALNQLKEYPSSSKERKETGQVQLSFKLRKNGEITEIKILQSSPYQQLNEAALNTVQRLGKFKPVPDEISKGDWRVILPIEFKLS